MGKIRCAICDDPNRKDIERDLLKRMKYVDLKKKYGYSPPTFRKHKREHIPKDVATSMLSRIPEAYINDNIEPSIPKLKDLGACINYNYNELLSIYLKAKDEEKTEVQLKTLRHMRECYDLGLRAGEILVSAAAHTNWKRVISFVNERVKNNPAAKLAISEALLEAKSLVSTEDVLT